MEAWKQHYEPVAIGKGLVILPAWVDKEFAGRKPIRINPGMAFGTGTHPTTQLCLEAMEEWVQPGMTVFDIGSGSGILSAGAILLGAEKVCAVDIDPASVVSTVENCKLNGVAEQVEVARGSSELVREGHFGLLQAPLVVANILASVLLAMLAHNLADLVEPGGRLLLSGILDFQAQEIVQAAEEAGFAFERRWQREDWLALGFKKKGPQISSEWL
jgi:ribosomal protein L11 methyltransferase